MGAVPKHKTSRHRQGRRRAVISTSAPSTYPCPQCGQPKLHHRRCPHCGSYRPSSPTKISS